MKFDLIGQEVMMGDDTSDVTSWGGRALRRVHGRTSGFILIQSSVSLGQGPLFSFIYLILFNEGLLFPSHWVLGTESEHYR